VVNGVPKGPYSEEEAREELGRVVRDSVKIPMEYYDDPHGRVNAASAFLERWEGARWIEVADTRRQIVLDVYLSEGHTPRRR
jgi:hypothetical protein